MAKRKSKKGSWLAADHGPLPGWGWVATAVGGYLIWHRLNSPTTSASAGGGHHRIPSGAFRPGGRKSHHRRAQQTTTGY